MFDVLAVQLRTTGTEAGWAPVPERLITSDGFEAVLVMVTPPLTVPVAAGSKATLRVAVLPPEIIRPGDTPLGLKPAPVMLTPVMLMPLVPVFVRVTFRLVLVPRFTLPNDKLEELAVSAPVAAFTVSTALPLVALPAELLTTTENCAPLLEDVSAGVV